MEILTNPSFLHVQMKGLLEPLILCPCRVLVRSLISLRITIGTSFRVLNPSYMNSEQR